MKTLNCSLFVVALGVVLGCGRQASPPSAPPSTAPATPARPEETIDAATAATIKGKVVLKGTPPKMPPIKFAADAACAALHPTPHSEEAVTVNADGTLLNVFVYVKQGLGNRKFPAPKTPLLLDQKGCLYTPHVAGVQLGQPVYIVNSDGTMHNIHGMPTATGNKDFNFSQVVAGFTNTSAWLKNIVATEVMVKVKCDVHPWMSAFVGVLDHPYFSVTGTNGTFSLTPLPPGTYVIEAWHEKYGTMNQTVTVTTNETKEITFEFEPKGQP